MIFNTPLQYCLLVVIMFSQSSCDSSKEIGKSIAKAQADTSQVVFNLDFQNDFKMDTILLKINNEVVFTSVIINSIRFLDFAQFQVYIVSKRNGTLFALYTGKKVTDGNDFYGRKRIKAVENIVKLSFDINGHQSIKIIDIGSGKFIGIGKSNGDSITIRQRTTPYQYD